MPSARGLAPEWGATGSRLGEIRFLGSSNSAGGWEKVLKGVRFHPRASHPERMVGGVIEGSQDDVTYTVPAHDHGGTGGWVESRGVGQHHGL